MFVGNKNTKELHTEGCMYARRMKSYNKIEFSTVEEALSRGYNGCAYCLPYYDERSYSENPKKSQYRVYVYTSQKDDAGTDASVSIRLKGEKSITDWILLNRPLIRVDERAIQLDPFERGNCDCFILSVPKDVPDDIGELYALDVQHNNVGNKPDWYLLSIIVENMLTGQTWYFKADRWIRKRDHEEPCATLTPGKELIHYEYLGNYPSDREPGWSEELNGVCSDGEFWYFTQSLKKKKPVLWKIPLDFDLNRDCKKENAAKNIYRSEFTIKGAHFGDIDHYMDYIFVPVSYDNDDFISVFSTKDIHKEITRQYMKKSGKAFTNIGWVAINPKDGKLYTADGGINETNMVQVYTIDLHAIQQQSPHFLDFYAEVPLADEDGENLNRGWMQGGCFDDENHLYLTNGSPYHGPGNEGSDAWNMANEKGGISIFNVEDLKHHTPLQRMHHSSQYDDFRFQFNGYRDEPEGITYIPLKKYISPGISGELHVIMINNFGVGDDDLYFKHYRRI